MKKTPKLILFLHSALSPVLSCQISSDKEART